MIKKLTPIVLLATALFFSAASLLAQDAEKKQPSAQQKKQKQPPLPGAGSGGTTPHETTSVVIGSGASGNRITVTYGRPTLTHPRTKEVRKIWGAKEPWDKPYRLGADEATLLITQKPLEIGGTTIPAGAYTLYVIPSESGTSKLAFSTKLGGWGIPVDTGHDLARVDLKTEKLSDKVEQLTISIEGQGPTAGTLTIAWDDLRWSVPFTVKST